jgi:hypothetical protein
MYGYNIHSGMPTMRGGISGHGLNNTDILRLAGMANSARNMFDGAPHMMHSSLGGYLLGGARGENVAKGKKGFQKKEAPVIITEEGQIVPLGAMTSFKPTKGRVKGLRRAPRLTKRDHINNQLHMLEMAERDAYNYELTRHPDYAKALRENAMYNSELQDMKRHPTYLSKLQFPQYATVRAKKGAAPYFYVDAKGKIKVVKFGSAGYKKAQDKGFILQPSNPASGYFNF